MSILQNAIDSVVLGVEDYQSTDDRRLISAARNIVAGILLLFKHKLWQLSPLGSDEVLIKERITPYFDSTGKLNWKGEGKKTLDVMQIRNRFDALKIPVDWARVQKIIDHRNNIEHYFSSQPKAAVRGLISDSFLVIRDFVRETLNDEPLDLFGQPTWQALTEVAEIYAKEKGECAKNISAINWRYPMLEDGLRCFRCPECGSELLDAKSTNGDRDTARLTCRSCGEDQNWETVAGDAITEAFSEADFRIQKDGGDPIVIECPSCQQPTYFLHEDICVVCEDAIPRECIVCGNDIPWSELDGGSSCAYCSHMAGKD